MSLLIKNAKIIIPGSSYNGKRMDVLIEKGKFKAIEKNITTAAKETIKSKNVCVSIGWMDIGAFTGEPGYEHQETLNTFEKAALSGGYTGVAVMPNTKPIVDNRSAVQYFKNNKQDACLNYYPIGAASKHVDGVEISEYMDMSKVGAIAFSDGNKSMKDGGFIMRALQYSKATDAPILNIPGALDSSKDTHMHEGIVSTRLGLNGSPSVLEKITLQRDIDLLEYTGSRLISHKITTSDACKLVKDAKRKDMAISATVSLNNLLFTDEDLRSFDSNLKLSPPLRPRRDQNALLRALKDDTIDAIVSDHQPREIEAKKLEFPYAQTGAIGLQTSFGAMWSKLNKKIGLAKLIEKLTIGPRSILGIAPPTFEIGGKAEITIFDPTLEWTFNTTLNQSRSQNSPWLDKALQGKVLGVCNNGVVKVNKY